MDKVFEFRDLAKKHLVFHRGVIRFPISKLFIGWDKFQSTRTQCVVIHPGIPKIDLAMGGDPLKEFEITGRFMADACIDKAIQIIIMSAIQADA